MHGLFLILALLQIRFPPHGNGFFWNRELLNLHLLGDSLITFAYYSILLTLIYFVSQRTDVPFLWVFWLFGAFLIACGTTHFLEIWTLWHPKYWLSGLVKVVTGGISIYTSVALISLIPKALALPSPAQLEEVNEKLIQEIQGKQDLIVALTHSEELFRSAFEGAAIGIALANMSGNIIAANPALAEIFGYSQSEIIGRSLISFLHPDDLDLEKMEDLYQGMVRDQKNYYQLDKRYLDQDNQVKWVNLTVSLVWGVHHLPQYSLSMVQDITQRKETEAELRTYRESLEEVVKERTADLAQINAKLFWQANYDELTQLLNRRAFYVCLDQRWKEAQRNQSCHTLCYLDLDYFKPINDTYGHLAGDEVLRQISRLFESCCRQSDTVCRLGGDEFAILLYQCPLENAEKIANTIKEKIRTQKFTWEDYSFQLGVSIGLREINAQTESIEAVIHAADEACYQAKRQGRSKRLIY
jgi:diguanylate cyclase (GGDEF)-like protein/PAS domain S-box-containing protein